MLAYTYIKQGKLLKLIEKPKHVERVFTVMLSARYSRDVCTSDLHIKHGGVPRAVPE